MVLKKFTKLSKDDTPMVRRGAVISIPKISKFLSKNEAKEHLLPVVERLLKDQNDSVKINSVSSAIDVAQCIDDSDVITETLLPALQ